MYFLVCLPEYAENLRVIYFLEIVMGWEKPSHSEEGENA